MPYTRRDRLVRVDIARVLAARRTQRPVLATCPKLIAIDPHHGAGHPDVARARKVGDGLRNVVALVGRELPVFR